MKKKSRQIDIEKMKRLICRRIKFFLLLAIVLSFLIVVVLGVSGNLSTNTNVSSAAASENATARARLTESQAEAVEESYKSYLELEKEKKSVQNYLQNSIYFNLDENSSAHRILYLISSNKVKAVEDTISRSIMSDKLYDQINKDLGTNIPSQYLEQLIGIEITSNDSVSINQGVNVSDDSNSQDKILTVNIYGKTKEQCSIITEDVKIRINTLAKSLETKMGRFICKIVSENDTKVNVNTINSDKMTYVNQLTTITNTIMNLNNSLSDDGKTYFSALIKNGDISAVKIVETDNKVSVKKAIVYFVLIFIIVCILELLYVILDYLYSDYIIELSDAEEFLNIKNVYELETINDNSLEILVSELEFSTRNITGMIGLISTQENYNVIHSIINKLDSSRYTVINSKPRSKEEFDKLEKISTIFFVEKINKSRISAIDELVNYYKIKSINTLGLIIVN